MAVPKKHTPASKKRIRKKFWKRKSCWAALKAFSLGKSISTGTSKSFFRSHFCWLGVVLLPSK